jgi:hypothetical protein
MEAAAGRMSDREVTVLAGQIISKAPEDLLLTGKQWDQVQWLVEQGIFAGLGNRHVWR